MEVDVVVCTYNSEHILDQCLSSIEHAIPYRKIFIIDNYSKDRTLEIAYCHDTAVHFNRLGLALSRKMGFQLAETRLVVNIDSDIVLPSNWFNRMMAWWKGSDVGGVWGVPIHTHPLHRAYQTSMFKFKSPTSYRIPHLGNMIARTDLVRDIVFPKIMELGAVAGEDYWIMKWVEEKGYRWVNAPVFCEHYTNPSPSYKARWGGACTRLLRRKKLYHMIRQVVLAFPQGGFAALVSRNPLIIPYWIRFRLSEMEGYLKPYNYFNLKREPVAV